MHLPSMTKPRYEWCMKSKPTARKPHPSGISRRTFVANAAAVSTFMVLTPGVLGRAGQASPNSKLNIAGVGIGGRGASDLEEVTSENIVALCDVDFDFAAKIFQKY